MSWSLVNKGLELVEGDLHLSDKSNSKFMVGTKQSTQKCVERKVYVGAIKAGSKKNKSESLLNIKVKRALETYRAKKNEDNTLKNIKLLNKIDGNLRSSVNEEKVKEYNLKKWRKTTDQDEKKNDPKKTNKSIFTEEDFEKMNNKWLAQE